MQTDPGQPSTQQLGQHSRSSLDAEFPGTSAALVDKSIVKVPINAVPRPGIFLLYAIQHTLGFMAATVLMPVVVGTAIGLSQEQVGSWISIALIVAGLATLMQVFVGVRLPIVQSASGAYVPGLIAVGKAFGLGAVAFGVICAGIIEAIVGFTRALELLRRVITPVVLAPTIALIGLSLFQFAANYAASNVPLTVLVVIVTLLFNQGFGKRFRSFSILIGIVIGTLVAAPLGLVDLHRAAARPWFDFPTLLPWGGLSVNGFAAATIAVGFIAAMFESIGDYYVTSTFVGVDLNKKQISRGIGVEGLNSIISGLLGGLPVTTYAVNAGIIGLTGVASRYVVAGAGVLGILLGIIPKFGQAFAAIPRPVFSGAMIILFGMIIMGGLKQLERIPMSARNMSIIGTALMAGLVLSHLPEQAVAHYPVFIKTILGSGMLVGAVTAVVLDQLIQGTDRERGVTS